MTALSAPIDFGILEIRERMSACIRRRVDMHIHALCQLPARVFQLQSYITT